MSNNDNTEQLIASAQKLVAAGQLDQALKQYIKVVTTDEREVRAWTAIGELYVKLGQVGSAVKSYKKLAQLHAKQKEPELALAVYEKILSLVPQDTDTHVAVAALYRKQGLRIPATRHYELAATALVAQGRVRESLAVVQQIVDMTPENIERRVKLAEQYSHEKMFAEAAREFAAVAAATYLRKTEPKEEDTAPPLAGGAASLRPAVEDEASRLLAEADSFLRLGLVDKAVSHLCAALQSNPSLRRLREPLVKLYVTQGQPKDAIRELWALLESCSEPQEEIRFLRYILRLNSEDPEAKRRLLVITQPLSPRGESYEVPDSGFSVKALDNELRQALGTHRPSTDRDATRMVPPPSATTRPITAEVEGLAEELALSAGSLGVELAEVDSWLEQQLYDDARRRLFMLAMRYPHSKAVESRLQRLGQLSGERHTPTPVRRTPTRRTQTPREQQPPASRPTIEVEASDIQEERAAPAAAPRPLPPPPPRRAVRMVTAAEAVAAYQAGASLRSRGQHEQAIGEFQKAGTHPSQAARVALMIGLCYRDLLRPQEAIASFKVGINSPAASDADLSELFYELGRSFELLADAREAVLNYQMSLGPSGQFRDSAERIVMLQQALTNPS